MIGPGAMLSRSEALTAAAGGSVLVTANRRLARVLKAEFDAARRAAGDSAWPTPEILPWGAWLLTNWDAALHRGAGPALPLSPAQERSLWEWVVADSDDGGALLQVPAAAALAAEAWALAHEWQVFDALAEVPPNEDGEAFLRWAGRYRTRCARLGVTDGARLPELVSRVVAQRTLPVPGRIVLCGFDALTPAQEGVLGAFREAECAIAALEPPARAADVTRVHFPASADELLAAARWARVRLEVNPAARIGVVLPQLDAVRGEVIRVFAEVMEPGGRLPGTQARPLPFNVSLGAPLAGEPLVHAALALLQLAKGTLELNAFGSLIRSPFLVGGESEAAARALVDARLRELGEPEVALARPLMALAAEYGAPLLADKLLALEQAAAQGKQGNRSPSAWAQVLVELLRSAGFPGERTLGSEEFQALQRWRELLSEFAALDPVSPRLDYGRALDQVRRLACETLFQSESPEVPLQVLGVLEAGGLEFDHLWVAGLTDEVWPPAPRPNPLLSLTLQRRLGMPHASAARELEFARRLTAGWRRAAGEVVFSHPLREGDRDLGMSPLIADVPEVEAAQLRMAEAPRYRDLIHASGRLERIADSQAPALSPVVEAAGGTGLFADQAACPFRAFAAHRLGAAGLEEPHTGLSALERGGLLHDALARVWRQLGSGAALQAMEETERLAVVEAAVAQALARWQARRPRTLSGRFLEVEGERLRLTVRAWLEQELDRGEFRVVAVEENLPVEIGGVAVRARLDRMDELPGGRRIILDYKSGAAQVSGWLGERPDEPQLPIYGVSAEGEIAALALARLKLGEMGFAGLARDGDLLPGIKAFVDTGYAQDYGDWAGLFAAWRAELERLAGEFLAGNAAVMPKAYPKTCEHCDLGSLCRIAERLETEKDEG